MRQMTKIHRLFFITEEQNHVFCTLRIDVEKDYNTDVNYLLYSHGFQSECLSRIRAAGILSITGWCGNILFGSLSITGAHRQKRCASPIGPHVHPDLTVWVDRQILHLDAQEKSRLSPAGLFLICAPKFPVTGIGFLTEGLWRGSNPPGPFPSKAGHGRPLFPNIPHGWRYSPHSGQSDPH